MEEIMSVKIALLSAAFAAGPAQAAQVVCDPKNPPGLNATLPGLGPERSGFLWAYLKVPAGTDYGAGIVTQKESFDETYTGHMDGPHRCEVLTAYAGKLDVHERKKDEILKALKSPPPDPAAFKAVATDAFMMRKWLKLVLKNDSTLAKAWHDELDKAFVGSKAQLAAASEGRRKMAERKLDAKAAASTDAKAQTTAKALTEDKREASDLPPAAPAPRAPSVAPEKVPDLAEESVSQPAPSGYSDSQKEGLGLAAAGGGATGVGLALVTKVASPSFIYLGPLAITPGVGWLLVGSALLAAGLYRYYKR